MMNQLKTYALVCLCVRNYFCKMYPSVVYTFREPEEGISQVSIQYRHQLDSFLINLMGTDGFHKKTVEVHIQRLPFTDDIKIDDTRIDKYYFVIVKACTKYAEEFIPLTIKRWINSGE